MTLKVYNSVIYFVNFFRAFCYAKEKEDVCKARNEAVNNEKKEKDEKTKIITNKRKLDFGDELRVIKKQKVNEDIFFYAKYDTPKLKEMVSNGVDVNIRDYRNRSLLYEASKSSIYFLASIPEFKIVKHDLLNYIGYLDLGLWKRLKKIMIECEKEECLKRFVCNGVRGIIYQYLNEVNFSEMKIMMRYNIDRYNPS